MVVILLAHENIMTARMMRSSTVHEQQGLLLPLLLPQYCGRTSDAAATAFCAWFLRPTQAMDDHLHGCHDVMTSRLSAVMVITGAALLPLLCVG